MAHDRPASPELAQVLRTGPFHLALRVALAERGLALHRVQYKLALRGIKVGVTSLSYWQQGARRPQRPESLRAVSALEEVLELPDGALRTLLTTPAHPEAGRPPARSYRSLTESSDAVQKLLADLGAPSDGGLHTVGQHERVRIGARRELLDRESQQVVRAHRDGMDRYIAIHSGDPGADPARVAVRATENCRVGRVRHLDDAPLVVAELLFDTRLRAGETYVFSYGFHDGTAGESTEYLRGFTFAGGQYVLQVRFDAAALPMRCARFAQAAAGAPRSARADLTLSGQHRAVHLVDQAVRPGLLGIEWDWG